MLESEHNSKQTSKCERLQYSRTSDDEKLPYVKAARQSWEQGINEELAAIAAEKRRPFMASMWVHIDLT